MVTLENVLETRRKQIIQDCHDAIAEFKAGGLKAMTAQEIIAELELAELNLETHDEALFPH